MSFELDPKAVRFIVDAITLKIAQLQELQADNPGDENAIADASNDIMYYRSLMQKLGG